MTAKLLNAHDWELLQEPHRHYRHLGKWSIGKTRIVSVTQVLDAADDRLQQWMLGQAYIAGEKDGAAPGLAARAYARGHGPEAIRDKAAVLGTISHKALEKMALGGWSNASDEARLFAQLGVRVEGGQEIRVPALDITPAMLWPRFRALEDFWRAYAPAPSENEVAVGSVKHAYAGTFDMTARIGGYPGLSLVDAKNTNMLSWRHPVQLAGYENARREMGMEHTRNQFVLRLTQFATFQFIPITKLGGYAHARRVFLNQLVAFRGERKINGFLDKIKEDV